MKEFTITAPRLYTAQDRRILQNGAVAVRDGRILYAGPREGLPELGCKNFDFPGCTVMPGLIDAHVHLTMDGSADPMAKTVTDSLPTAALRAAYHAEQLIKAGITTVRDCGCQGYVAVELARAVEEGRLVRSPKILACGPVLCITGGHGTFIGMEIDGPQEARKAARTVLKNGAKFLKLISTGGVITRGSTTGATQLDPDEVAAIVNEAKKVGVKTATHAHGTEGIKIALRAGVDTIEHASYVDDEGIGLFLETGAVFVSTLLASQRQIDHLDEVPSYVAEKISRHIGRERESVCRLIAAGVTAVGGTDAGTPFNPHGHLAEQLQMLEDCGLTKFQALEAGTKAAAEALGIGDNTGTLSPGKCADILVVRGSPAEDLNDLTQVAAVWRDGIALQS